MAVTFQLIETRQISGVGSIKVETPPGVEGSRADIILFDLIRPATNRYRNFEWFPPRERIANLTFRRNGVVLQREVMEFERQAFFFYPDPGGQALVAIQCAYKGILQTFFNLGNALSLPSISIQNDIATYTRFESPFSQVAIKCYADAAIAVSLYQLKYEVCGDDSGQFQETPVLPPPPAQTPPGDPITPSEPYDPNDTSEPYAPAGVDIPDEPEPEFVGNECQRYRIVIEYTREGIPGTSTNSPRPFAPVQISSVRGVKNGIPYEFDNLPPGGSGSYSIQVFCRGLSSPCQAPGWYQIGLVVGQLITSANIVSAVPN
jgi:hypothetical protein